MPSIDALVQNLIPPGVSVAQWLTSRGSLNGATGTINSGISSAQQQLQTASQAAIDAQKKALDTQKGLYDTTTAANEPYSQTGLTANGQLQGLIKDPTSLENDPGYQFELSQGLLGGQRAAAAGGTLGNGGTIRAQTRYALDFANTKYNDAVQRLLQVTAVGERANTRDQEAANTFGSQVGTEATNEGNIGTRSAEDQAGLTLAGAQLNAKNQVLQGNNTVSTLQSLAPTIAKAAQGVFGRPGTPAIPGGPSTSPGIDNPGATEINSEGEEVPAGSSGGELAATAGAAAPTIAGAAGLGGGAATAAGTTSVAIPEIGLGAGEAAGAAGGEAAAAAGAGEAAAGAGEAGATAAGPAAGGIGGIASSAVHALTALATNPITWGVAAAIGGALIWRATQTHQTADKFVKGYQDPFVNTKGTGHLNQIVDAFDKALATGQMTKEQAQIARDQTAQFIQQFEADGAAFAKKGDKEASVWNQAQRTMAEAFGGKVDPKGHNNQPDWSKILGKMDQEIAQLPAQAA